MREERSLQEFENRMLRRIFGPKMDEATGEWGIMGNEEFNGFAAYQHLSVCLILKLYTVYPFGFILLFFLFHASRV